jgi:hypothetical protein
MRVRRWLLILLTPAMLITLLACGASVEETVTIDGETITRREFELVKNAMLDIMDAIAEEDWERVWNYLDAESKEQCPRLRFVTSAVANLGLAKTLGGDAWWRAMQRGIREIAGEVRSISWQELQRDPDVLNRKVNQRWTELTGRREEYDWSDWHFEGGQVRFHWPDACER